MEKRFKVSIEKDSDGSYIAYNTNGKGYALIGRGDTVEEAKSDFLASMKGISESETARSGKVSEILTSEPDYRFDVSSLFEYYSMINVSAFARYVGINDSLMRQYRRGNTYVSEEQLKKIEQGIHRLGNELSRLSIV